MAMSRAILRFFLALIDWRVERDLQTIFPVLRLLCYVREEGRQDFNEGRHNAFRTGSENGVEEMIARQSALLQRKPLRQRRPRHPAEIRGC